MRLAVVGLNHNTASVAIREKAAFTTDRIEAALTELSHFRSVDECLILSTCNRTEIYAVFHEGRFDPEVLGKFMAQYSGQPYESLQPYLYEMHKKRAVEHLFRVVSGLDSMVLGETQIAAQAKQAYRHAVTARANGPIFNKLFHIAFRVSKKVRTLTGISEGSLSVSQLACHVAEKRFDDLSKRSVLLVGAGENGELTARHLIEKGVKEILIANRTFCRAETLAKKLGAVPVEMDHIVSAMEKVNVVISSTASPDFVITAADVKKAMGNRHTPLVLIDLAVPRDIDPEIAKIDGAYLHDLDSLQRVIEESLTRRKDEGHKAKAIVAEEVEKFLTWNSGEKATPLILEMRLLFDHIRSKELEKLRKKLSPDDYFEVDQATRAMMNKVLHMPIESVRNAARKEDSQKTIRLVRKILGLSEE